MSYSNPLCVTYKFASHDFGAGAGATSFKAPAGYTAGRLIDVGLMDITETFTNTTTPAYVRVGTASDADAYAQLDCGVAAATDCYNTKNDTDAIIDADLDGSQIEVTFVAPTGGTPAGIASAFVVVEWF